MLLLWIFNVSDAREAIDAAKRQRAGASLVFLRHRPSTNEKDMIGNSDAGESVRSSAAPAGRLEDYDRRDVVTESDDDTLLCCRL